MPKSLQEYARQREEKPPTCIVCIAPPEVREAVERNEAAPTRERLPRHVVVSWAKDVHETPISADSIYRHMRSHI